MVAAPCAATAAVMEVIGEAVNRFPNCRFIPLCVFHPYIFSSIRKVATLFVQARYASLSQQFSTRW